MTLTLPFTLGCSFFDNDMQFKGIHEDLPGKTFRLPEKTNANTTEELLEKFEGKEDEIYRFGKGDKITIDVWDHPELSGKHTIGPDGYITLPMVGPVRLADLSRHQGAQLVNKSIGGYYPGLPATIRIDHYVSNRVQVLGRVTNPGFISFDTPPTLLEAITLAGGLPVGGSGSEKAALTRCAVFRGQDRMVWIDLRSVLTGRNLNLNIRLQRNDIVYIPDADSQLIYVLGHVHKPGAYHLTPGMSILDALARAGGPNMDADDDHIQIVRPGQGFRKEFSLDDILKPDRNLIVAMDEGDILYIPASGIAQVGYVAQQLSPLTQLIIFSSLLLGVTPN